MSRHNRIDIKSLEDSSPKFLVHVVLVTHDVEDEPCEVRVFLDICNWLSWLLLYSHHSFHSSGLTWLRRLPDLVDSVGGDVLERLPLVCLHHPFCDGVCRPLMSMSYGLVVVKEDPYCCRLMGIWPTSQSKYLSGGPASV